MTNRRTRASRDEVIRLKGVDASGGGRSAHLPDDEGPYTFVVVKGEDRLGKDSGKRTINWQCKVSVGGYKGKNVYHNTSLQPQALFNLKQMMIACGVDPDRDRKVSAILTALKGKTFQAYVVDDEYNGKLKSIIDEFVLEGEDIEDDDAEDDEDEDEDEESDDDEEEEDEEPAPVSRRRAARPAAAAPSRNGRAAAAAPARTRARAAAATAPTRRRRAPVEEEDEDEDLDDIELDDL